MNQQEQSPQGQGSGIAPPFIEDERNDVGIAKVLSTGKLLKSVVMVLKGYYYDHEEKEFIKIDEAVKPLMNEKGITRYIMALSSGLNDVNTFSSYDIEEIERMATYVLEQIIPVIHMNWTKFGIEDECDLDLIDTILTTLTYASYKKAMGAGDRSLFGRTYSESNNNMNNVPEKKGFFNNLLGGRR